MMYYMLMYMIECKNKQFQYQQFQSHWNARYSPPVHVIPEKYDMDQLSTHVSTNVWNLLTYSFQLTIQKNNEVFKQIADFTEKTMKEMMPKLYMLAICTTASKFNDIVALATCYCNLSMVYNEFTAEENLHSGKRCLEMCLELLTGHELDSRAILIVIKATVQLHDIFCKLKVPHNFLPFLKKAVDLYLTYTKENDFPEPVVIYLGRVDVEGTEQINPKMSLVMLYGYLLSYMTDFYNCEMLNLHDFIMIAHKLLNIRSIFAATNPINEGVVWAFATVEIAQYFLQDALMIQARNYLSAVQYIMDLYDRKSLEVPVIIGYWPLLDSITTHILDLPKWCKATLAIAWGTYGRMLLSRPYNTLQAVKNVEDVINDQSCTLLKRYIEPSIFTELGEKLEHYITNTILEFYTIETADTYASSMDDAKLIFVRALTQYDKAQDLFYKMGYYNYYYHTVCDIVTLYNQLALFKEDKGEQKQLHKRRLQILQNLYNDSKQISMYPDVHKRIITDLVQTNAVLYEMAREKYDILKIPTEKVKNKMHEYLSNVIKFNLLLLSLDHPIKSMNQHELMEED